MQQGSHTLQSQATDARSLTGTNTAPVQVARRQSTTTCSYDRLSRLRAETRPEETTSCQYDPIGKRSQRAQPSATETAAYDRADRVQQVQTVAGNKTTTRRYPLNTNGNVVQRGKARVRYDDANRLTNSAVRRTSLYADNGDGLRVKTNAGQGPLRTHASATASGPATA